MLQTFLHNTPHSGKYYLIRVTPHHWQPCISQFCDITKSLYYKSVLVAYRSTGSSSQVFRFNLTRLLTARVEVKDTRLEAKNTQKNPRPRTAFPRTHPPKAKDTGTSVLHEKKVFKKVLGDLRLKKTKNGLRKFFQRFLTFSNKFHGFKK